MLGTGDEREVANTPKLPAALVAAQKKAQAVDKSSRNDYHRYAYASAEAIIAEARAALSSAGLACVTAGWTTEHPDGDEFARIVVTYNVLHESGEGMTAVCSTPVIPEKGRPRDKAEATALTYNLGYYLRGLLLLPRVEEGTEPDQRDDTAHEPPARKPKPAPKPEPNGGGVEVAETRISRLDSAEGTSKKSGKKWHRFDVFFRANADADEVRASTFDRELAKAAKGLQGQRVEAVIKYGDKGNDLLELRPLPDDEVPLDDLPDPDDEPWPEAVDR